MGVLMAGVEEERERGGGSGRKRERTKETQNGGRLIRSATTQTHDSPTKSTSSTSDETCAKSLSTSYGD